MGSGDQRCWYQRKHHWDWEKGNGQCPKKKWKKRTWKELMNHVGRLKGILVSLNSSQVVPRHDSPLVPLLTLTTLPLLRLPDASLKLPRLVILSLFLGALSSFSSSFLGGIFSFPLPSLLRSKQSFSVFSTHPSDPAAATTALKEACDAVDNIGVDCVRRSIPVLVVRDLEGIVMPRPTPSPLPISEPGGGRILGTEDEADKVELRRVVVPREDMLYEVERERVST